MTDALSPPPAWFPKILPDESITRERSSSSSSNEGFNTSSFCLGVLQFPSFEDESTCYNKKKKGFIYELTMPVANLLKKENNGFDSFHPFHHQTNFLVIYSFFLSPTIFSTLPIHFHSRLILHFIIIIIIIILFILCINFNFPKQTSISK